MCSRESKGVGVGAGADMEIDDPQSDKKTTRPRRNLEKKEERPRFSLTLSRKEIEDDFFAMTGNKPPRRPKRRSRAVQAQINILFSIKSDTETQEDGRWRVHGVDTTYTLGGVLYDVVGITLTGDFFCEVDYWEVLYTQGSSGERIEEERVSGAREVGRGRLSVLIGGRVMCGVGGLGGLVGVLGVLGMRCGDGNIRLIIGLRGRKDQLSSLHEKFEFFPKVPLATFKRLLKPYLKVPSEADNLQEYFGCGLGKLNNFPFSPISLKRRPNGGDSSFSTDSSIKNTVPFVLFRPV
ncbi:zinc finger, CCHC-type containing protein [Tanacetum coccineum]